MLKLRTLFICMISVSLYSDTITDALKQNKVIQQRIFEDQQLQFDKDKEVKGVESPQIKLQEIKPRLKKDSLICHDIKSIIVNDVTLLDDKELIDITSQYNNRCLNENDVAQLMATLTNAYIKKGYITSRVYIGQQNIALGTIVFNAKEGKIASMKEDGETSFSVFTAFPIEDGDYLNLRDLEQGINQVNRLQSNNIRMSIEPSDNVGESDVVFKNTTSKRWTAGLSLDNQGSASTGAEQIGISVGLDDLLGINDYLNLSYKRALRKNHNTTWKDSESFTFSYIVPFGYNLFSMGRSISEYQSTLSVAGGSILKMSGVTTSNYGQVERIVFRNQKDKVKLSLKATAKETKTYISDQLISISSRKLTIFDFNTNWNHMFSDGSITFDLGFSKGSSLFGAVIDSNELPYEYPKAQGRKMTLFVNYNKFFSLFSYSTRFSSSFQGQKSNDVLYGSEQISIGGLYSVRGFERTSLAGDSGYYIRNDLVMTFYNDYIPGSFQPYIGLDSGYVVSNASESLGGRLTGSALGLKYYYKHISADVAITKSLYEEHFLEAEAKQIYFRIGYDF